MKTIKKIYNWLMKKLLDAINPVKYAQVILEKSHKSSGLAPLLAQDLTFGLPTLIITFYSGSIIIQVICLVFIIYLAIRTDRAYFKILDKDPNLLHTETHIKEMKQLAIIEAGLGDNFNSVEEIKKIDPNSLKMTKDPEKIETAKNHE